MILTNHTTEQLLGLCRQGNGKAQLEIYNRYNKAMFNISWRIVRDVHHAEDIMQEAFLAAFTKLDSLKHDNTFGAWLKRIVVNRSLQFYKNQQTHKTEGLDGHLYKIEAEDSSAQHLNEVQTQAKKLLELMAELQPNYRLCLTLHLVEGYDYEEVAEIMDITYGNCRTMISRAKDKLRAIAEPYLHHE